MPWFNTMKTIARNITFLFVLVFSFPLAASADPADRSGFWGSLDLGGGYVQEASAEDGTRFFIGGTGGYAIDPHFLPGLELSIWSLEAGDENDPNKGKGLMQVFLVNRFYPEPDLGLFGKMGGGYINHWNNQPGESGDESGWGMVVGAGYDFQFPSQNSDVNWAITPIVSYNFGKAGDRKHDVINFSLGVTFY